MRYLIGLVILISITLPLSQYSKVQALIMENSNTGQVVEELRLRVPLRYKDVWLRAESRIWEPWLQKQKGYLGRELFYDKEKEEALVLVSWEDKKLWKSIALEEVNRIQTIFETTLSQSLKLTTNPLQLIYEGELTRENEY